MRITIPIHELEFTYARSSGPGGQNVNKVNSKAILRWNAIQSATLAASPPTRKRVLQKLAPKLTTEGDLVITSDRFRDQPRNRQDCIEKLQELLTAAAAVPTLRKATRPSHSSRRTRVEKKRKDSAKKRLRSRIQDD